MSIIPIYEDATYVRVVATYAVWTHTLDQILEYEAILGKPRSTHFPSEQKPGRTLQCATWYYGDGTAAVFKARKDAARLKNTFPKVKVEVHWIDIDDDDHCELIRPRAGKRRPRNPKARR